jgi:transglutaminase-like putative cysteine protease
MLRFRQSHFFVGLFLAAIVLCVRTGRTAVRDYSASSPSRTFSFVYRVHVPANAEIVASSHLWIPIPQADGYQEIHSLHIDSPVAYSQGLDPEYGNRFAMFTPTPKQITTGFDVAIYFTATRHEHKVPLQQTSIGFAATPISQAESSLLQRYLQPDQLIPLNNVIAKLAKENTIGDTTPLQKAHHIYEYVLSTMRYDKSGEGWGRGDAVWACTSKRGNCTDFHSLLIGMMRSAGIPARFEVGFPIPEGQTEADIPGYHCWAEFYIEGPGWIPVDASEASKNPAKREYFFGANDDNRVFFSFGRDIQLSSAQKGAPLNFFIYPYAEVNGEPVKNLQSHFSFRDVAAAPQAAAK